MSAIAPAHAPATPAAPAGRAWLAVLRAVLAVLLLLGSVLLLGLPGLGISLGIATRPQLALQPAGDLRVDSLGRAWCGKSHIEGVGGITYLHLVGDAHERGHAFGLLLGPQIAQLERGLLHDFTTKVPGFLARHLIVGLVAFNGRNLPSQLRADELAMLAAATAAHRNDPYADLLPAFTRALHYHALHDISQYLIDNPLVVSEHVGCTAVCATDAAGHLLVGRLFDFEGGAAFDEGKVVMSVAPTEPGALGWMAVGWPGMTGAVTGMNEAGLWVSINAAATRQTRFGGRPTVLAAAEVLQHCRSIAQAEALLASTTVFVSDAVLVASCSERRAVVIELGPSACHTRELPLPGALTNHFLHPAWAADNDNALRISHGTTLSRHERASELLATRPTHDPLSLLEILRDRRGLGGRDLGFNHRGTINAWIGAHAAVADLDAGLLWVAEPKHGLGRALAFDLRGPRPDVPPLPASPDLALCQHSFDAYLLHLGSAQALRDAGQRDAAFAAAQRAAGLNPMGWEPQALIGELAPTPSAREAALRRALALLPPYRAQREQLTAQLRALGGAIESPP